MEILEFIRIFSKDYADAVSAVFAALMFGLALATLLTVRREFIAKYRPYVMAEIQVDKFAGAGIFGFHIVPRNVGPHLCEVKLKEIKLVIGDESYSTPDNADWILLSSSAMTLKMPIGHINESGIEKIRAGRYKSNRVEVQFQMHERSIDKRFKRSRSFVMEINFLSDLPVVEFRPEWIKEIPTSGQ